MWGVYFDTQPFFVGTTAILGRMSRRAYYGPLAPLRARDLRPVALPGKRWIRVRNRMAGIGAEELSLVHLDVDPRVSPVAAPRPRRLYLGREVVGEVVEVGPGTQFLRVGDRVAYQNDQSCATREIEPPCRHCAAGNYALCENRYLPGPQAIGGGWSEEMVLHERQVFLIPDGLTDEQAALVEPTAVALRAAMRRLPQPGETSMVIGAGTIGLLTTQAVRALGPEGTNITVLARYPFQVEMAARMGGDTVLYDEDLAVAVARLTGGQRFHSRFGADLMIGGFDTVYDTVGTSSTLNQALRWTRAGGTVVLVGNHLATLRVDMTPVWHQEIAIVGSRAHGAETPPPSRAALVGRDRAGRESTFQLAARLLREHRLTPERLITHRFPAHEVRRALAVARKRAEHRAIKVMLDMRDPSGLDQPVAEVLTEEVQA